MSAGDWEELLADAKRRLSEQEAEEQEASAELGEVVELAEEEAFTGRWRGYGTAWAKRDGTPTAVDVYLLWDIDGARRFIWPKTRLRSEIDELQPNVGDEIAIVRGTDIPNSDPALNPTQRFAVRVRPCDDPLPDAPAPEEPASDEPAADDDIPF